MVKKKVVVQIKDGLGIDSSKSFTVKNTTVKKAYKMLISFLAKDDM